MNTITDMEIADVAMQYVIAECNDEVCSKLIEAFNSVRKQSIADTTMVCAQLMGRVMARCPEFVGDEFWLAFQKLTFTMAAIKGAVP